MRPKALRRRENAVAVAKNVRPALPPTGFPWQALCSHQPTVTSRFSVMPFW
jgi:hypothetical protein